MQPRWSQVAPPRSKCIGVGRAAEKGGQSLHRELSSPVLSRRGGRRRRPQTVVGKRKAAAAPRSSLPQSLGGPRCKKRSEGGNRRISSTLPFERVNDVTGIGVGEFLSPFSSSSFKLYFGKAHFPRRPIRAGPGPQPRIEELGPAQIEEEEEEGVGWQPPARRRHPISPHSKARSKEGGGRGIADSEGEGGAENCKPGP